MEQDKSRKTEQKTEEKNEKSVATELLSSLKAELFDPELAEKYQKAQEAAQMFFALYTELQRAGFTKQEAYGMIVAMIGGNK